MEIAATSTASVSLERPKESLEVSSPDKDEKSSAEEKEPLDDPLSTESRRLAELKKTDRAVRAHEQAHVIAGGQYIRSGAQLQFAKGPDGRSYAVAGEVSIDAAPIPDDPAATILKMEIVRRAALAPIRPSSQDQAVAARASQEASQARSELLQSRLSAEQGAGRYQEVENSESDSKDALSIIV